MHQHECNTKFKPYGKFLITYRTKFRLNARLSKINPRKMNKPIKFIIKCWNLNQGVTFAPSFVRQPNGPECTQIVRNAPKRQFRVRWGALGAFVAKHSDATSCHELLHQFGPFCTEFRKATKRSRIHLNGTKCTKHISLGLNGVDQLRSL